MSGLVRGEQHGGAKLKAEQVLEIFKLAHSGSMSQREIAKRFGISQSNVAGIKSKQFWRVLWEGGEG